MMFIYYLSPNLAPSLTLSGSNYPYLERISMVPKMFELSRFDCTLPHLHKMSELKPNNPVPFRRMDIQWNLVISN